MAAESTLLQNEEGQSVLEFVLMLPVLLGLTAVVYRVNAAIQMSIVNQQYSRAQALFLAFNSPVYPELRFRMDLQRKGYNQMVLGVSDNPAPKNEDQYNPEATVWDIAPRTPGGSNEPQAEPDLRTKVRIRNTVHLCTQSDVVGAGSQFKPIQALTGDGRAPIATGENALVATVGNVNFLYCRGRQE